MSKTPMASNLFQGLGKSSKLKLKDGARLADPNPDQYTFIDNFSYSGNSKSQNVRYHTEADQAKSTGDMTSFR